MKLKRIDPVEILTTRIETTKGVANYPVTNAETAIAQVQLEADQKVLDRAEEIYVDELHKIAGKVTEKTKLEVAREIFEEIVSKMALERCDPDVMAYFTDYYWIPRDVLEDLKQSTLKKYRGEEDA